MASVVSWPDELVREIAEGRVVIFFGAGVSATSKSSDGKKSPPGWWSFLELASKKLPVRLRPGVRQLLDRNNLLLACDVIRDALTPDVFKKILREEFHDPGYSHSDAHSLILRLAARISITPNFDVIYDSFVSRETSNTVLIKNYYDDDCAESLRSKYPVVLKLHGTITTPDKLIFTASDYAKARSKADGFYELIRALLCTHTILFIGCGLDDPDIRVLLEDYRYRYGVPGAHYFLIAKGIYHQEVLKAAGKSLNLKFIEYNNKNNDYSNFVPSLEGLVRLVELRKASSM